jgi:hypothetical protein
MNTFKRMLKKLSILYFPKIQIYVRYFNVFGTFPDLKNPYTFTEKIQWLKLYDKNPLKQVCADKIAVRQFVEDKVGKKYLIPIHFTTQNLEEINEEKLPDEAVIIKPNHDCGGGYVVLDKTKSDLINIREKLKARLSQDYSLINGEWQYHKIIPKILVEKFLTDDANSILNDYKIHCFNGKPKYIQVICDRETDISESWFDTDWIKQDFYYFSSKSLDLEKIEKLNEMLELAVKLSQDFSYVRVDLYIHLNEVFFGELTFHPFNGVMKWSSNKANEDLGDLIELPKN